MSDESVCSCASVEVGTRALLVEVDDLAAATAVHRWIVEHGSARTSRDPVTSYLRRGRCCWTASIRRSGASCSRRQAILRASRHRPGIEVVMPVHYDGADLAEVARSGAARSTEVVERHQGDRVRGGVLRLRAWVRLLHRHANPCRRVPRRASRESGYLLGRSALAGEFCGLYPNEMPGGWQLIGRTEETLVRPRRGPSPLCCSRAIGCDSRSVSMSRPGRARPWVQ